MTITDQMVEVAIIANRRAVEAHIPEVARWPDDYDDDEQAMMRESMRAALEAAEAAAWQPIGDAPCDGTTVLVYAPPPDPEKWHESVCDLPAVICTTAYHEDAGFCIDSIREPTHWRPLPAAPKETT